MAKTTTKKVTIQDELGKIATEYFKKSPQESKCWITPDKTIFSTSIGCTNHIVLTNGLDKGYMYLNYKHPAIVQKLGHRHPDYKKDSDD